MARRDGVGRIRAPEICYCPPAQNVQPGRAPVVKPYLISEYLMLY